MNNETRSLMKKYYYARWIDSQSLGTIGNVSFFARSMREAIQKADRIGRELGLPNSARTIHENTTLVHEKKYGESV